MCMSASLSKSQFGTSCTGKCAEQLGQMFNATSNADCSKSPCSRGQRQQAGTRDGCQKAQQRGQTRRETPRESEASERRASEAGVGSKGNPIVRSRFQTATTGKPQEAERRWRWREALSLSRKGRPGMTVGHLDTSEKSTEKEVGEFGSRTET